MFALVYPESFFKVVIQTGGLLVHSVATAWAQDREHQQGPV